MPKNGYEIHITELEGRLLQAYIEDGHTKWTDEEIAETLEQLAKKLRGE